MHLLIVEGNKRETWSKREASGGVPYHKRFLAMLKILCPEAKVDVAFPADEDALLPSLKTIMKYDGVLWTGSSLYVNDPSPSVAGQLTFAEDVFKSGVPFYGSCWGLQIAAVVAGGTVGTCEKGREFGVTSPISLTKDGANYNAFKERTGEFNALCIHLDEVTQLPENTTILASNAHSRVQALTINYKNSEFFGVQYHPEFMFSDLVFIARYMSKTLIKEGVFDKEEAVESFVSKLEKPGELPECVSNYLIHTQEVKCWLDYCVNR